MSIQSNRSYTILNNDEVTSSRLSTLNDFFELLQSRHVKRVTLKSYNNYLSRVLSNRGSQFVVYAGDGIEADGPLRVVVKLARVRLGNDRLPRDQEAGRVASSVYREISVLTHPQLWQHDHIIRLLWYDLIEDEIGTYAPALIVERAEFGNLAAFLDERRSNLDEAAKGYLSAGVTAGLHALHGASVIHGDVKCENILICRAGEAGSLFNYTPKVADFGSSIFVAPVPDHELPRYSGTPLTNAPEVSRQTTLENRLDALGLVRCDAYSLGLLIFEVAIGSLPCEMTAKDDSVMAYAQKKLESTEMSTNGQRAFAQVFQSILPYSASSRCGDLSVVTSTFQGLHTNPQALAKAVTNKVSPERKLVQSFGGPSYFDFTLDIELESEPDTQAQIYSNLKKNSKSQDVTTAGKALFQLALASATGFGTPYNLDEALDYALQSSKKGYLPAMAVTVAWYGVQKRALPVDVDVQIDWLFEATAWGSFTAASILKRLDLGQYAKAREAFHRSGGYNQFYHSAAPPAHLLTLDFIKTISVGTKSVDQLGELAELAATYGAIHLMARLLDVCGLNPNLINPYGESLVLLCCKAGHLELLRLLKTRGATITPGDSSMSQTAESPFHWLIAFEDDQVQEAAQLLADMGKGLASKANMVWNHPSIDLPGRFPLGSPLHFAAHANSATCVNTCVDVIGTPLNWPGDSELTPFELGCARRKLQFSRAMVARGCLEHRDDNLEALHEFTSLLKYEAWTAAALDAMPLDSHVDEMLGLVLSKQPEYLNQTKDGGFTPIMQAVTYRDRTTVRALVDRGCDVNAETSLGNYKKTALTFVTETKMQHEPDDIVEILLEAKADLHHCNGHGMQPLHYAVRNNCPLTTEKFIRYGADVNNTTELLGTPLHWAALYGSLEAARVLLENGADPRAEFPLGNLHSRSWDKLTPLAIAALRLRRPLVELLLRHHSGWLARPVSGHTVLHLAVTDIEPKMLEMLLGIQNFCDPKVLNHRAERGGATAAVLCAANPGRHKHLALLLEAGADPNIKTESGHTALDVAIEYSDSLRMWLQELHECRESGNTRRLEELRGEAYRMLGAVSSHDVPTNAIVLAAQDRSGGDEDTIPISMLPRSRSESLGEPESDSEDEVMEDTEYKRIEVTEKEIVESVRGYSHRIQEDSDSNLSALSPDSEDLDDVAKAAGACETRYIDALDELNSWEPTIELLKRKGGKRSSKESFDRLVAGSLDYRPEYLPDSFWRGG